MRRNYKKKEKLSLIIILEFIEFTNASSVKNIFNKTVQEIIINFVYTKTPM